MIIAPRVPGMPVLQKNAHVNDGLVMPHEAESAKSKLANTSPPWSV